MEHMVTGLSFQEQSGSSPSSQPLQRGNEWGWRTHAQEEHPQPPVNSSVPVTDFKSGHMRLGVKNKKEAQIQGAPGF